MTDSNDSIISIDIEDEMRTAYIDYAMSVIVSRALPDVRDGLKPVHRRVLFSMQDLGLTFGKPYKKSARIVGECFVAGTKVATPKGLISIEELKIGDEVFTQNAIRKVTQLYEMPKQDLLEVNTKNGMQNICTQGQMFKVYINENATIWKKAIDLKLGDNLICCEISDDETSKKVNKKKSIYAQDEDFEILEQEITVFFSEIVEIKESEPAITYDIQVETDHEFIANGMLVHNCLGKYHPHGDSSVYDTMVRMAQPWSLRYPLVDGQGNFGSVDGDSAAAMRYTEARLQRIAEEILIDINKDTIDFQPNFDDSLEEPSVLPCKIPHLLINGTSGIAVGMATNMPPHNISEVIDGIMAYLDDEEITIKELMKHVPAPDFPTGGSIYGYSGVRAAMETGRGRVVVRAKHVIEDTKTGKTQIIVTEIPYMVNKANLIERTWELVQEKKIEGITAIRDESDRDGMRIVYDLRRDAMPLVVLNQLFKYTSLQSSFSVNNVALVKGRPQLLNIKELMVYFIEHRHEVIYRRTAFELKEAKARQHILEGLLIALDNLDAVIKLIRGSKDVETARTGLIDQFGLSEIQARAILDMRLQRLTALERDKIVEEYKKITELIARLEAILADKNLRADIIKEELADMKAKYGDARRTEIIYESDEFTDEDMIPEENMVLTISHNGYIKRTSLEEYRRQNRGGVGSRGTSKSEDYTEHFFVASTHDTILIFTHTGLVFWLKAYQIPEVDKTARGRNIQNLLQMDKDEQIKAVINVRNLKDADFINNHYLVMCTEKGIIKKTLLEEFSRPRQNGIRAINFQENDSLLDVKMTNGNNEIILAVRSGRAIRFNESKVRAMGRTATGVRGIDLDDENDKVVGLVAVVRENANLLVVSEKGYGKRSDIEDYRVTNRGGKGIKTLNITEKTGKLVSILEVVDSDDLMIINKSGLVIRMPVDALRVMGRATQGVRLIRLQEDDEIASITNILEVITEENTEAIENEDIENIPIADEIPLDENLNGHHENGIEE